MPITSQGLNLPQRVRVRSLNSCFKVSDIVERIENSRGDDDGGDRGKLGVCEAAGEQNKGHHAAREEIVHHVAADRAEREHYQIFLSEFKILHIEAPII